MPKCVCVYVMYVSVSIYARVRAADLFPKMDLFTAQLEMRMMMMFCQRRKLWRYITRWDGTQLDLRNTVLCAVLRCLDLE